MAIPSRISSKPLVQRIVRTLYPYGSIGTVRRGPLKGSRLVISPAMGVSYLWHADAATWQWVRLVKPGCCVYDIGANFGQSTLLLAHAVERQGRVIAFEPMPATFRTLCRNLELNSLAQVTPVNAAVAAASGVGGIEVIPNMSDQGRLASLPSQGGSVIEVRQVALDDYQAMGWPAPDVLKVDVEGGAGSVFAGAHRIFEIHRPLLYLELHSEQEHEAIADLCQRHRYIVFAGDGQRIADPRTAYYGGPFICRPSELS